MRSFLLALSLIGLAVVVDAKEQAAGPTDDGVTLAIRGSAHDALFAVDFLGTRGTAVGANGAVLDTQDGGNRWASLSVTDVGLLDVSLSPAVDIAVGQQGIVLVRKPGGSWSNVPSGTRERLMSVAQNGAMAVVVGSFGVVIGSTDGGQSWRSIAPDWESVVDTGVQPHLYAAHIDRAGVVTITGEFGLILQSNDGGATWKLRRKEEASLFGLEIRDDGIGYAVGQSGTLLRTEDGGVHWNAVESGTSTHLLAVRLTSTGMVIAAGMRDILIGSDTSREMRTLTAAKLADAWYADVALADGNGSAFVVGQSGQIVRIGR